jgi:hypothetical protein
VGGCATHLLEDGYDIRTDVRTTMIYTHVLGRGAAGVLSPADRLLEVSRPGALTSRYDADVPGNLSRIRSGTPKSTLPLSRR